MFNDQLTLHTFQNITQHNEYKPDRVKTGPHVWEDICTFGVRALVVCIKSMQSDHCSDGSNHISSSVETKCPLQLW